MKIAKIFGIPIVLDTITLFFILGLAINFFFIKNNPQGFFIEIFEYILIFLCIIIHEFGHIFIARKYGIKAEKILILPIGCIAVLEKYPEDSREFFISVAGPIVSIILTLIFGAFNFLWPYNFIPQINFFSLLFWINLIVTVFNLFPIYPLDGGRIFVALLMPRIWHRVGTVHIARQVAIPYIILLFIVSLKTGSIWIPIILILLLYMGQYEYKSFIKRDIKKFETEKNIKLDEKRREEIYKKINKLVKEKYKWWYIFVKPPWIKKLTANPE